LLLPTSRVFASGPLTLASGDTLPELAVAYETYGSLSASGDNAILLCHGYTSNPHAAGDRTGWWQTLIGPGKAIDTDQYFVVCANMLGSAYASTGPGSINPATGVPYGPDFPTFSTDDILAAQERLIDHLGVGQLAAVIGFSYGGFMTFLWGVSRPDRMRALVPVATGISGAARRIDTGALRARFAGCAGWSGGHYYTESETSGVPALLQEIRSETLTRYGLMEFLDDTVAEPDRRQQILQERASQWAGEFDANALIALRDAANRFDVSERLGAIKAPLLYVLSRSDALFPPSLAPPIMAGLEDAGVDASYFEIDSDYGHMAPTLSWREWATRLLTFLDAHAR